MLEVARPQEINPDITKTLFAPTRIFDKFIKNMANRQESIQTLNNLFYVPPKIPENYFRVELPVPQTQIEIPRSTSNLPIPEIDKIPKEPIARAKSKPILTPRWDRNTSIIVPSTDKESNELDLPNYAELHFQLECCEYRISHGIDQRHMHAGQLIEQVSKKPIKDFSEAENARSMNYEKKIPEKKIPDKWDLRPWENESIRMTESESAQLYSKIDENRNRYMHSRNWILRTISYKVQKGRPHKKKTAVVIASQIVFDTDDEGDLTDWEDFEL